MCASVFDSSTSSTTRPTTSSTSEPGTPDPTTSQTGNTQSSGRTSTGDTTRESLPELDRPPGGLSAGAKGGIAAGVVIAALIVIGFAVFCFCPPGFIKRRQKRKNGAHGVHRDPSSPPKMDGRRAELDGVPRSELEAKPATGYGTAIHPAELGGDDAVDITPGSVSRLTGGPPTFPPHSYSPTEQRDLMGSYDDGHPVDSELSATQQTTMPVVVSTTSPELSPPPAQLDTSSQTTEPVAMAHFVEPAIDPSSAELEQLLQSQLELEARRRTLEELSRVQEQQAVVQQRINELAAARKTPT